MTTNTIGVTELNALLDMPFDLEIMGRIYWQAKELWLSQGFDLLHPKDHERDRFVSILLDVTIKLAAMQYHLNTYEQYEANCIEQMKVRCGLEPSISLKAYELLYELEAFMFQMKSALDLAAKFPEALFPKRFSTKTFGAHGKGIIKGLENFKKDKTAKTVIVDAMISMIRADQDAWLKQAISFRTTLSHFKTIAGYNYQAHKTGDTWQVVVPRIVGLEVHAYMKAVYSNCLEFIQEFMCLSIGLFLPAGIGVCMRGSSPSSVVEPLAQYIKYGVALTSSSTTHPEHTGGRADDREK